MNYKRLLSIFCLLIISLNLLFSVNIANVYANEYSPVFLDKIESSKYKINEINNSENNNSEYKINENQDYAKDRVIIKFKKNKFNGITLKSVE